MRYRSLSAIAQPDADELLASADVVSTPQASIHDPGFGEERERQIAFAQTCFPASAGVGPALLKTIETRPR